MTSDGEIRDSTQIKASLTFLWMMTAIAWGVMVLPIQGSLQHYSTMALAKKSAAWISREATISKKTIEAQHTRRGVATDYLKLEYVYEVNGKSYLGSRYSFHDDDVKLSVVLDILPRFEVGKKLTVYVNPETPAESVVERRPREGERWSFEWSWIVCTCLLVLALGCWTIALVRHPEKIILWCISVSKSSKDDDSA